MKGAKLFCRRVAAGLQGLKVAASDVAVRGSRLITGTGFLELHARRALTAQLTISQ